MTGSRLRDSGQQTRVNPSDVSVSFGDEGNCGHPPNPCAEHRTRILPLMSKLEAYVGKAFRIRARGIHRARAFRVCLHRVVADRPR
jgi:hypothetical protein